jgi:hypothetical protein
MLLQRLTPLRARLAGGAHQCRPEELCAAGAARRHHLQGAQPRPARAAKRENGVLGQAVSRGVRAGPAPPPMHARAAPAPPSSSPVRDAAAGGGGSDQPAAAACAAPPPGWGSLLRRAAGTPPERRPRCTPPPRAQRHRTWTKTSEKIMFKFVECAPRARHCQSLVWGFWACAACARVCCVQRCRRAPLQRCCAARAAGCACCLLALLLAQPRSRVR